MQDDYFEKSLQAQQQAQQANSLMGVYNSPQTSGTTTLGQGLGNCWPYTNYCHENVHAFACDHALTCKCGLASRKAKACPTCGCA